jgi:5-methyltetrahydrofolate--homocysteine methyltransferase
MIPFTEALAGGKLLILDGAFGTQLAERGGGSVPLAVLESPDIVRSIHADYKAAGANVVLTNTLLANPISLQSHAAADRLVELNQIAVKLCREAVGDDCYVAGDIGSTGKLLEPYGDHTEEQFFECFVTQSGILARSGADLLIIETMTDINEAAVAVKAAKSAADIPVIATISFDPGARGFRTVFGQDPAQAVAALLEAGADAIGSNCGTIDPVEMSQVMAELRAATDLPLCAEPNAGKPELSAGKVTFSLSPEDFADGVADCVKAGATLVGGCCGTTPAHIAALARRFH